MSFVLYTKLVRSILKCMALNVATVAINHTVAIQIYGLHMQDTCMQKDTMHTPDL